MRRPRSRRRRSRPRGPRASYREHHATATRASRYAFAPVPARLASLSFFFPALNEEAHVRAIVDEAPPRAPPLRRVGVQPAHPPALRRRVARRRLRVQAFSARRVRTRPARARPVQRGLLLARAPDHAEAQRDAHPSGGRPAFPTHRRGGERRDATSHSSRDPRSLRAPSPLLVGTSELSLSSAAAAAARQATIR